MTNTTFNLLVLSFAALATAETPRQPPQQRPVLGKATSQGCFTTNSPNDLLAFQDSASASTNDRSDLFMTVGQCNDRCRHGGLAVALLHRKRCLCGDVLPRASLLTSDDKCDYPCPGFPVDACGGLDAVSVYNTGLDVNVPHVAKEDTNNKEAQGAGFDRETTLNYVGYVALKSWGLSKDAWAKVHGFFCGLLDCGQNADGGSDDDSILEMKGQKGE